MSTSCEHWEMAFCVIDTTIYIKCSACKKTGKLTLDDKFRFNTNSAKMSIDAEMKKEKVRA